MPFLRNPCHEDAMRWLPDPVRAGRLAGWLQDGRRWLRSQAFHTLDAADACQSLLGRQVDKFRSFPAMRSLGLPIPTHATLITTRSLSAPRLDPTGGLDFCPEFAFVLLPHGHPFLCGCPAKAIVLMISMDSLALAQ